MTASALPNPFMTIDPIDAIVFEAIVRRMVDDIAIVVATIAARVRP